MKIPIEDSIDLHAFAPRDVASVVEEYVNAAHETVLREIRLIHGRGKGVQRGIVQQALERHPLIEIRREEIALPPEDWDQVIVATGPLTSPALAAAVRALTGEEALAFFDAIADSVQAAT